MKPFPCSILAILIPAVTIATVSAAPVVPGLFNMHPLSESRVGELLIDELQCRACHRGLRGSQRLEKSAPDLSAVGSRVAPEFLQRFIASPSQVHRSTTMPDILTAVSPARRDEIAKAITQYLVAQSPLKFQRDAIENQDVAFGRDLFHSVGCVACHSPRDENGMEVIRDGQRELGHIGAKYSLTSLTDFLFRPTLVRPSGRMPDMKLAAKEAQAIAGYLLRGSDATSKQFQRDDKLVIEGKKYFQQFNCAACHKLGDGPAAPVGEELPVMDSTRGCLSSEDRKSPRFHLSIDQVQAIQAALAAKTTEIADQDLVAMTMTAFNCIACHSRDGYGGVSEDRNLLFQTNEKNLGDDGRIPPPLTLVGAKLQPTWMKKVLFDAESVRPYMFTRMPQYGSVNLSHLPELFSRLDSIEPVELPIPNPESDDPQEREREKILRAAGRELLGTKGLSCIACHNFNGKPSPTNKGMDLMTSYQRLTPSWFYHFVREPNVHRPRIVMPVSWPGGVAVLKSVLDGDTNSQINAIWYYLSLGTSAQDPPGIQSIDTKIQVTDTTRTYRGRSSVAGYRGIAVGFPAGLHYAFNAETGSLTAIWRGEFVRVDRSGQGSGGFNPASRFTALAQDVSFFDLKDEQTPWPLRPTMKKEAPVNPDPLYPKNRGYQFQGYYLDDLSIPTFMYRSGDIEIEDFSTAEVSSEHKIVLQRTIQFSSPRDQTIWFLALTGNIQVESKQQFKVPDLLLSVPPTHTVLRPLAQDEDGFELLLKISVPTGKSKVSLLYEPLP